jgi:hypothetical protein
LDQVDNPSQGGENKEDAAAKMDNGDTNQEPAAAATEDSKPEEKKDQVTFIKRRKRYGLRSVMDPQC